MVRLRSLALASVLSVANCSEIIRLGEAQDAISDPFLLLPPGSRPEENGGQAEKDLGEKTFTLRHVYHHGSHKYPQLHRYHDVRQGAALYAIDDVTGVAEQLAPEGFKARIVSTRVQRMVDRSETAINKLRDFSGHHGYAASLPPQAWTIDEIPAPNSTDKETVLTFARMAADAYVEEPFKGDWQDVRGGFNYTEDFGWEQDGLRGHIFADTKNQTVVIGLKGTSPAIWTGKGTTEKDKLNDNLFAACCCGQGGQYGWLQPCDCMLSAYTCNQTCLVKSLQEKDHYYNASRRLYHEVVRRYPAADIWLSGHSLGGVVSSLLGMTYGLPAMTFEAFPDALAASRLGLPTPPGYSVGRHNSRADVAIYHYGHTADPIYQGTCNSATSFCTIYGYAFESGCHTGKKCVYDTSADGWSNWIGNHQILNVIRYVLEKYDVPKCEVNPDCPDCYKWKFVNGTATTTMTSHTSTSTSTHTRTETCKTPGWWGCLDKTSTITATTTTSTSSSSTTTCKTPGWFGCKDPTTTASLSLPAPTITTIPTLSTSLRVSTTHPVPTTTCETPGWFGCKDKTTSTSNSPTSNPLISTPKLVLSTSTSPACTSKKWFGLICMKDTATTPSPSSTLPKVQYKANLR